MRIALGIEYDGAKFCGWQSQPSKCSIQDGVQSALNAFVARHSDEIAVTCAGRTDTGVHALNQVVHFDTNVERDESSWVRGTNAFLPETVRILWAKNVSDEFHARFSAYSRTYRYLLLNDSVEPALMKDKAGWFHAALDLAAMRVAASKLIGEHDFSAFRAAECQAKSPVRKLHQADIHQHGHSYLFEFRANAFLHHMIRNLVGELIYVGAGRHSQAEFQSIMAGRVRSAAAPTFSPAGLYLTDIEYDPIFGIPPARDRFPLFR